MRILFLCHRTPFPPDKGDKIGSYNLLRYLAARHEVHAGFLVDDPDDARHVPTLRSLCASVCAPSITARERAVRAALSARPGRSLTQDWFRSPALQRWVGERLAGGIDAIALYGSAVAPYVEGSSLPTLMHMTDVDSLKFNEYARTAAWPKSWVFAREARTLGALERRAAGQAAWTTFVSHAEADLFRALAPEHAENVGVLENGVDLDFFSPAAPIGRDPYPAGAAAVTFTGTMDYPPNVDAVTWFADAILPGIRAARPDAAFWIVGNRPQPAVLALARRPGVHVTGRVDDIRPWMAHAACIVAPLRLARGIQNKVIEAMAMGRPVVTTPAAFEGIRAEAGRDALVADDADTFTRTVLDVLAGRHPGVPEAARAAMVAGYAWSRTLAPLDAFFRYEPAANPCATGRGVSDDRAMDGGRQDVLDRPDTEVFYP